MNNRRKLIVALGTGALAWAGAVFGQSKKPPVLIGWLSLRSRESDAQSLGAVKEGLVALGWKEGSQVVFEERWADGRADRLPSFVKELAAKKPAMIVADGMRPVSDVANWAPNIPIVMVTGTDPVAAGVVASLARPGGMVTGVTGLSIDLTEKYLEFLLAAAPKVKRVGFLGYSRNPNHAKVLETARRSVAQHSVEARFADAASPDEIEPALSRLAKEGAQALVVLPGSLLATERQRILKFALAQRWPVVAGGGVYVEAGALLSYSADRLANFRRAAYYVDRILKGTKPADLPIEQPTKFDLVINLKTAKAMGLTIPQSLLLQATKVIE
jgi:putative ABC transport system substrate-binding protein